LQYKPRVPFRLAELTFSPNLALQERLDLSHFSAIDPVMGLRDLSFALNDVMFRDKPRQVPFDLSYP
jgi:hypothetical protein